MTNDQNNRHKNNFNYSVILKTHSTS